MKAIFRSLLVYVLLLALPFQAFAAGSMRPLAGHMAAAAPATPAAEPPPCHQQMAAEHGHQTMAQAAAAQDDHAASHAKGKCGTCAACCVGAAMAPGLPASLALAPPSTIAIPFRAGHLPSVDPVLLERPPSTLAA